jgi:3',5'-cyclic-nucleotide phosphodiesterase
VAHPALADAAPSPFSEGPGKSYLRSKPVPFPPSVVAQHTPTSQPVPTLRKISLSDDSNRQSPNGSHTQNVTTRSQRSSREPEKSSRYSSENQSQSRRGSGDASLTAILVTQTSTPPGADRPKNATSTPPVPTGPPSNRGNPNTKTSTQKASGDGKKESPRPLTAPAPSSSRRGQGKDKNLSTYPPYISSRPPLAMGPDFDSATNVFPISKSPAQRHSELDLTHGQNGNLDGSRALNWDSSKPTDDSGTSRHDPERDASWWRQMSHRRRTRDLKPEGEEPLSPNKEMYLAPFMSSTNSNTNSALSTCPNKDRNRPGKWSRIFRRKTRTPSEKDRDYASPTGSTTGLATPPTSHPQRGPSDTH